VGAVGGEKCRVNFLYSQHLFGQAVSAKQLLWTRLAQERFVHGGGMFDGRVLTVLYFEDLQVGRLAAATPSGSDEIKLARFTGTTLSNNEAVWSCAPSYM
jgi:hypothetical protein